MTTKNKKRSTITEEEEEKYLMFTEVFLFYDGQVFDAKVGCLEMRDGHRTLEVFTDDEEQRKITITKWVRTWPQGCPKPCIHTHEAIEGWF